MNTVTPQNFANSQNLARLAERVLHEGVVERARDIHMAASIDVAARCVYMTGAIDENDQNLAARIVLPEPGVWTFYKAETNLTNESWTMWQILLGDAFRIPSEVALRKASSRQFKNVLYREDVNAIMFYNGEVRPGEPVLKIFNVEVVEGGEQPLTFGMMSHSRLASTIDEPSMNALIKSGLLINDTSIEVDIATTLV